MVGKTRKFNGKRYTYHKSVLLKREAQAIADKLRKNGKSVRLSRTKRGITGTGEWQIWVR